MKANLQIEVVESEGISQLQHCYFTTPLKVMNITEDKKSRQLHLMLMSSSPGILDGDEYQMEIKLGPGSSLQLHTQAYQRIFTMKQHAIQQMNVHLAHDSSFCYLPHPSVPHEQSSFTSRNNFYLGSNCHFIFGEVLTCGRKLNGELFVFSKYHSISNVYLNNRLVIKENLLMQPALITVHAIGQLEGYTHQASMLYLQENVDIKSIQQQVLDYLLVEKNIEAGVTTAPVNGLIIRLLGNGAELLYSTLQHIITLLKKDALQPLPA